MDTVGDVTECRSCPKWIAFLPDSKNWKAISSTERFDNDIEANPETMWSSKQSQKTTSTRADGTVFAR